jgi:hypothetical protein
MALLSSLALATTTAAATALYFFKVAQKPMIYYSKKHEALVHACQSLHETLYPTFYLLNPHLSTIVTSKMRRHVPISFQREIFPLSTTDLVQAPFRFLS